MKDRIKAVRKSARMTQAVFGQTVGVSLSAVQKWELGIAVPSEAAVMNICSKFGIRKEWLLTGADPMRSENSAAIEMSAVVEDLFRDKPESFKARLISALLRFDADSPQWKLLEDIYESVADEAVPDESANLHAALDRQLEDEKRESSA